MAFFLVFCIGGGWCIGLLYGGNGWLSERQEERPTKEKREKESQFLCYIIV